MILRLEWLHSKNLIHRDIKPDNFLMGIGMQCNTVFLADYGLAKRYRNSVGKHIKYRDDKSLTGTARYASVNTHYGSEQSRRDDLESLGYVLVYFMKSKLPWQNLKTRDRTKNRYEAIAEKKLTTSIPTLCLGCPAEFQMYLQYCRGLKFDETPDYNYLRQLFKVLLSSMGYELDHIYDWTNIMDQTLKKKENSISSGYASSDSHEKKKKEKSGHEHAKSTSLSSRTWLRFPFGSLKFGKSFKNKDTRTSRSKHFNGDPTEVSGKLSPSVGDIALQSQCISTRGDRQSTHDQKSSTGMGLFRNKMRRSMFGSRQNLNNNTHKAKSTKSTTSTSGFFFR